MPQVHATRHVFTVEATKDPAYSIQQPTLSSFQVCRSFFEQCLLLSDFRHYNAIQQLPPLLKVR